MGCWHNGGGGKRRGGATTACREGGREGWGRSKHLTWNSNVATRRTLKQSSVGTFHNHLAGPQRRPGRSKAQPRMTKLLGVEVEVVAILVTGLLAGAFLLSSALCPRAKVDPARQAWLKVYPADDKPTPPRGFKTAGEAGSNGWARKQQNLPEKRTADRKQFPPHHCLAQTQSWPASTARTAVGCTLGPRGKFLTWDSSTVVGKRTGREAAMLCFLGRTRRGRLPTCRLSPRTSGQLMPPGTRWELTSRRPWTTGLTSLRTPTAIPSLGGSLTAFSPRARSELPQFAAGACKSSKVGNSQTPSCSRHRRFRGNTVAANTRQSYISQQSSGDRATTTSAWRHSARPITDPTNSGLSREVCKW